MIKIVIAGQDVKRTKELFEKISEILKNVKLNCELSFVTDPGKILGQPVVAADSDVPSKKDTYDIYLLYAKEEGCMKFAKKLRERNLTASLVWVGEEALFGEGLPGFSELFRYRPSAYLVYPLRHGELREVLHHVLAEQQGFRNYFMVKNKDQYIKIPYSEILWFDSRQRIVTLHTGRQEISFYGKLKDVEALLPARLFLRCHQSYLVNLDKIVSLDRANRFFVLQDGTHVEISKSYYQEAVEGFRIYMGE